MPLSYHFKNLIDVLKTKKEKGGGGDVQEDIKGAF